ncbi:tRNA-dependent cyclodipeptide synthase [Streptomyces ossamyceticus]|uniref:tRNA-dependent cyclodipeptide synthase n=1 Tax=Streptomyces ossamyceticus TaxID=249581 RepID=UPI0006E44AEB|nr:tRNA-dependent cyclodipeptide synthase [Streptomyces ossamyceticus]
MSARRTFEVHEGCFFGISLQNSNFAPKKLHSMLTWISRRFDQCTVLVGDSIHRITLESTSSLAEPEATEAALRMGSDFLRDSRDLFDSVRDTVDLTFLRCSEVQQWVDYAHLHKELRQHWETDPAFRASVEGFARRYHESHAPDAERGQLDYRIRRSCEYFLEEFAIFACLRRRGLRVMVYPGSFSTLSEITRGEHVGTPKELQELIIVSLSLKGK